jgi:hypothetical protein
MEALVSQKAIKHYVAATDCHRGNEVIIIWHHHWNTERVPSYMYSETELGQLLQYQRHFGTAFICTLH